MTPRKVAAYRHVNDVFVERALARLLFRITKCGWPSGNPYLQPNIRECMEALGYLRGVAALPHCVPQPLTDDDCPPNMRRDPDGCWEVEK